jgi:hypothetical protein
MSKVDLCFLQSLVMNFFLLNLYLLWVAPTRKLGDSYLNVALIKVGSTVHFCTTCFVQTSKEGTYKSDQRKRLQVTLNH